MIFTSRSTSGSSNLRPMRRLTANTVFKGLVMAWRLAICPTRRSPLSVKATTEGVVRLPSTLGMTLGSPPSIMATQELVVPKSMPMTFDMEGFLLSSLIYLDFNGFFGIAGYYHHGRAQQAVLQKKALLQLLQHGLVLHFGSLLFHDGMVVSRAETLPHAVDGGGPTAA